MTEQTPTPDAPEVPVDPHPVLTALKAEQLRVRKAALAGQEVATIPAALLTVALGEITTRAKNEQRDPTDADVVHVAGKLTASAQEIIAKAPGTDAAWKADVEIVALRRYLPKQMDAHELREAVGTILNELGLHSLADRGKAMAELKARHAGRYDGKAAAALVQHLLTPAGGAA